MKGTWTTHSLAGKAVEAYGPAGADGLRYGVLYLHDGGLTTLREIPAFTRVFDELHLACVCPHGQFSWWGDRICRAFDDAVSPEQFLLGSVLPFFHERWSIGERAVALLGVSMGGQGALRLAFKYPERFPVVAGISSSIDYHEFYGQGSPLDEIYESKEQCRQDTAPMHLHPSSYPPHLFFCVDPDDLWFRGNDRLHEKMNALGVPHEVDLTTRAGGHSWDYFNRMADRAIRFVHAGLVEESRRLL
jgi:esterase/lipase superfamily enzyme